MNKKKLIYNLFYLAIFFQIIPNLNIIRSNNIFFTTNFLSLLLIILLGIHLFFASIYSNFRIKQDNEGLLILVFLAFQALSIINIVTLSAFLLMFINITSGVIIYFVTKSLTGESLITHHKAKIHSLNTTILLGGIINILFQLSLLIFPDNTTKFINIFFSKNLMEVTKFHYVINNKLYSNFSLEILTPILLLNFLLNKNITRKISSYLYLIIIFILAFVSNFRYRLAGYFVSITSSIFLFRSFISKVYKHIFIYSLFLMYFFYIIFTSFNNSTIINRFIDVEEYSKFGTIAFRFNMFEIAYDLGTSRLLGVGLGNTYDYLKKNLGAQITINKQSVQYSLMGGAHNIFFQTFAETGLFGLLSLMILVIFWLIKDINLLDKGVLKEKKVYILMFWTLIFISLFIPSYNTAFYIFLFLLRGLI